MDLYTTFLVMIVFFAIVLIAKGIRVVDQAQVVIIERFGKYHRVLKPGINWIIPIMDKPHIMEWRENHEYIDGAGRTHMIPRKEARTVIDMRETVYDFPRQSVITKDNATIEISAVLYFQITDPVKAAYEVESLPVAIEKLTQTTLRNIFGELDLDQTYTAREKINSKLLVTLDNAANKWGVKVNRVELQDIIPPTAIREAMEKQMKAERDRRATVTEAEGLKTSQILKAEAIREAEIKKAEGMKQAAILEAEGIAEAKIKVASAEAESIKILAAGVGDRANPANYQVSLKYIEALSKMTEGKDNKVIYMPYEASNVLGAVAAIKDLTGGAPQK
ncbi:MAG: SPFH/Band 7/PHB domain protein [Elusimicrobiaceae bacterium]|nr:SPFH/Band 7/PHB domain protein [Elusimicrobiaceae bacterium]